MYKDTSSLGDFSDKGSFGKAFNAAHRMGGSGHTFEYKGKMYTTDTADGSDFRTTTDDRGETKHLFHAYGHAYNATRKEKYGDEAAIETTWAYGLYSGNRQDKPWPIETDKKRANYHWIESKKAHKK